MSSLISNKVAFATQLGQGWLCTGQGAGMAELFASPTGSWRTGSSRTARGTQTKRPQCLKIPSSLLPLTRAARARCLHTRADAARALPAPTRPCSPRCSTPSTHVPWLPAHHAAGLPAVLPAPRQDSCTATGWFWGDLHSFWHSYQPDLSSRGGRLGLFLTRAAGAACRCWKGDGWEGHQLLPPWTRGNFGTSPPGLFYYIFFMREFLPVLQSCGLFLFPEWKPSPPSPALQCLEWAFGCGQTHAHHRANKYRPTRLTGVAPCQEWGLSVP